MIVIIKHHESKDGIQTDKLKNILDNNAKLIDGSMLSDMARIEVQDHNLALLQSNLGKGWDIFPEKKYSVPDTKRKVKG